MKGDIYNAGFFHILDKDQRQELVLLRRRSQQVRSRQARSAPCGWRVQGCLSRIEQMLFERTMAGISGSDDVRRAGLLPTHIAVHCSWF